MAVTFVASVEVGADLIDGALVVTGSTFVNIVAVGAVVADWTVLNAMISAVGVDTFLLTLTYVLKETFIDVVAFVLFFLISVATRANVTSKCVHAILKK